MNKYVKIGLIVVSPIAVSLAIAGAYTGYKYFVRKPSDIKENTDYLKKILKEKYNESEWSDELKKLSPNALNHLKVLLEYKIKKETNTGDLQKSFDYFTKNSDLSINVMLKKYNLNE